MRRMVTFGVSAAMLAVLVNALSSQGYSCSFSRMKAAWASGRVTDWVSSESLCEQVFGHACGVQGPASGGAPSRPGGLQQAVYGWEARGRSLVTFLCN